MSDLQFSQAVLVCVCFLLDCGIGDNDDADDDDNDTDAADDTISSSFEWQYGEMSLIQLAMNL